MDILSENTDKPIVVPPYYNDFRCKAGTCRHNCCIGWEIDIDADALNRYRAVTGPLGEKLRRTVAESSEGASFILRDNGRCPFLTDLNLCELILERGEGMLCRICRDHPRFINEYDDRLEVGLGMSCEAAAELILRWPEPEGQPGFLPEPDPDFLLSLERLDENWTVCLNRLKAYLSAPQPAVLPKEIFWENAFRNLYDYVLFRYGTDSEMLACHAVSLVRLCCEAFLWENGRIVPDDMIDICRMYSAEIEYSDENLPLLEQHLSIW